MINITSDKLYIKKIKGLDPQKSMQELLRMLQEQKKNRLEEELI